MKLDSLDIKFLLANVKNEKLTAKLNAYSPQGFNDKTQHTVSFDEIELDALEDELTRLLTDIGLDDNDDVNSRGVYIERLIDRIREEYK